MGCPTCSLEGEGRRELESDPGSFHSKMAQLCQEGFFHCTATIGLMTGKLIISTSCLPRNEEEEPRNTWAVRAHSDLVSRQKNPIHASGSFSSATCSHCPKICWFSQKEKRAWKANHVTSASCSSSLSWETAQLILAGAPGVCWNPWRFLPTLQGAAPRNTLAKQDLQYPAKATQEVRAPCLSIFLFLRVLF